MDLRRFRVGFRGVGKRGSGGGGGSDDPPFSGQISYISYNVREEINAKITFLKIPI